MREDARDYCIDEQIKLNNILRLKYKKDGENFIVNKNLKPKKSKKNYICMLIFWLVIKFFKEQVLF